MSHEVREATVSTLWDVESTDGVEQLRVADMTVAKVSTAEVREFAQRYHYTGVGNNVPWRYGLWHGLTLLGVVAYNLPTRDVCIGPFGEEYGADKVVHMGRLMCAEQTPRNSESKLIAGSLKLLKRDKPELWAVVTYAATDAGHLGYVYQATNALYTGTGGDATYYLDPQGNRRATYLGGSHVSAERAASMGWRAVKGGPKHRYLYLLGSKTERRSLRKLLRWPVLPYPKELT